MSQVKKEVKNNPSKSRNVKIKALKEPNKDKVQHMKEGDVYEVGEDLAKDLIKQKRAEIIK